MWQEIAVACCVMGAVAYLTRNAFLPKAKGCGSACGGCTKNTPCPPEQSPATKQKI